MKTIQLFKVIPVIVFLVVLYSCKNEEQRTTTNQTSVKLIIN